MKSRKASLLILSLILVLALGLTAACGGNGGQAEDVKIEEWSFGTEHEFNVRPDGLEGLTELYDFEFDDVVVMDYGVLYQALRDGQVASAVGYETDGRIKAFDLVNLEDDKNFFPVYNPTPIWRGEIIDEHPELEEILNPVAEELDTETLQELNARVDVDDEEPEDVAKDFLLKNGFIDEEEPEETKGEIVVGSKQFTEQLLLGKISVLVLEDAGYEVEDQTGLGGTEVCRKAINNDEIDHYWEYTGTAWLASLGHEDPITDSQECYEKVKEEDMEENSIIWSQYAPANNTYTIMMREEDAENLGIETISDLAEEIKSKE